MSETGLLTLLASLFATIVAVGGFFLNRRKTKADVATLYEAMNTRQVAIIAQQREREENYHAALREREDYIIVLLDGIGKISSQAKAKGCTSIWEPPKPAFLYDRNGILKVT